MIQIDSLKKSFGDHLLFSEASFSIGPRERCAIAGRNGSGKSTLLKILSGDEEADFGKIHLPKGHRVGALPQHLHFTEKTLLEEAVLGLPVELRGEPYRVEILLGGLGFTEEDFEKAPQSFSGGYQLRLSLCKALAQDPDLLLLDEPTNYLDILAIRWLESFLRSWHGQILFISHDREFVNRVCTHIIGIRKGRIRKIKGSLENYTEVVERAEETHELARVKIEKKKAHMLSFVERFGAKATKAAQAQARLKAIEKLDTLEALEAEQILNFSFNYKPLSNRVLLTVKDLTFSFKKEEPLIRNVNFQLEKGEHLAIIGKNGSGKSTLLRLLLKELKVESGEVIINQNVATAYFGQTNIERLKPTLTIEEELSATFPEIPYGKIRGICGAMLFTQDDAKKSISVLSGGERSRVLLGKILLTPANVLLLDEPTHHLDMESVEALMMALEEFEGSVILVTHDESVLRAFKADKLIVCHKGHQNFFLGTYDEFLDKGGWEEERLLLSDRKEVKKPQKNDPAGVHKLRSEPSKESSRVKREIEKLEVKIEQLEVKKSKVEEALAEAATKGKSLNELTKQFNELSEEIGKLYEELLRLT